jgi:hypothetical protein
VGGIARLPRCSGEAHDEGAKIVERVRARFPALKPGATALAAVALADVIFAVDSVPAILAITTDTFIVFSANAFALLGLRALFFLGPERSPGSPTYRSASACCSSRSAASSPTAS